MSSSRTAKKEKERSTRGRAWTHDEVAVLLRSWREALKDTLLPGTTAKMVAAHVYDRYLLDAYQLVEAEWESKGMEIKCFESFTCKDGKVGPEGGLNFVDLNYQPRSQRSVEDKMASAKQTYTLIKDHERGTLVGSTGQPPWFSRPPQERAAVLSKWKRVAMSEECFSIMDEIHADDPAVEPMTSGVAIGVEATAPSDAASAKRGNTVSGSDTSPDKKRMKVEELKEVMNKVMATAMRTLQDMAREEAAIQREKNEKDRDLMRMLFDSKE